MNKRYFIIFFMMMFTSFMSIAQGGWTNYGGVPGLAIKSINRDDSSNVWIAMFGNGLSKMKNSSYINFTTSTSSISSNTTTAVAIDNSRVKWIGTFSAGVCKYDGATWTAYNTGNGLPGNQINCIAVDAANTKWFGINTKGVTKMVGTVFTTYNTGNSSLPNNNVNGITCDAAGNVWMATYAGLAKLNGSTWTVYSAATMGITIGQVYCVTVESPTSIWVGTSDGLLKFNGTSTWTRYHTGNSSLPYNYVKCIDIDQLGNKWVGTTQGGLAMFDGVSSWTIYNTMNSFIPSDDITDIMVDATNKKWVATNDGGLAVYSSAQDSIATLSALNYNGIPVPGFASGTYTYSIELPFGTTIVPTVTATTTSVVATYVVNNAAGLPGATTVVVTAEDGTHTKTYTINFTLAPPPVTPVANFSGTPTTVCAGQTVAFTDLSTNTPTSWLWTFSGGTPATSIAQNPTVTYNTAGTYNVALTAANTAGSNTKTVAGYVTVNTAAVANAGVDKTVCYTSNATLSGSIGGSATSATWTGGAGIFNPNNTTLAAVYDPTGVEISAGTITLTLTTNDPAGVCGSGTDKMVIYVNQLALATAGSDQTICSSSNATLNGNISGGASSASWVGGTGTFNPSSSSLNAVYTPSSTEIAAGSVTLTLTTDNPAGPCVQDTDPMTIIINLAATANAGVDQTVCYTSNVTLAGSLGGSALTATWTGGAGTYNPWNIVLDAVYDPTAAEIAAGSVTLTLTTNDPAGLCAAAIDRMVIRMNPLATANAGSDKTICAGSDVTITGAIGGAATYGSWSGGSGTFSPSNTALTVTYTPSVGDISAGNVTITLTTDNPVGPCVPAVDNMNVLIYPTTVGGDVTSGSTPILLGNSTGTMTLSGSTGTVLKWQKRLDAGAWTDISNTTNTYSEYPSVEGTWDYRAEVQSGTCASTFSNAQSIVVNTTTNGSITGGVSPVCEGTSTGTMTLSGHTGTVVRWEKRLNSGSWTTIANTTTTYDEIPSSVGTWEYRAYIDISVVFIYSSTITVVVDPAPLAGSVTGGTSVCLGSGTGTLTLAGNTGAIFRWQKRQDAGTWSDIVNSNNTYSEIPSAAGIWDYRAEILIGSCAPVFSTETTVTVSAATVGGSVTGGSTVCEGTPIGTLTLSGNTGTVINWQKRIDAGAWSDIASTSLTYSEIAGSAGLWDYRANVQNGACAADYSTAVSFQVDATPNAGSISGGSSICIGSSTGTLTLSGHSGTIVKWQKRRNANAWVDIANTITTYSETPDTAGTWDYRAALDGGLCGVLFSSPVSVIVIEVIPVITVSSDSICAGGEAILTASGGSTYMWEGGVNLPSITVSPSATETFTVIATTGICSASDSVTITVNDNPIPQSIAGPQFVVPDTVYTYSVNTVAGITFEWILVGGTIQTGQGTQTVDVKWGATEPYLVSLVQANVLGCTDTAHLVVESSVGINENNTVSKTLEMIVFPNPSNGDCIMKIVSSYQSDIELFIYNHSGQLIKNVQLEIHMGLNNYHYSFNNSGAYMLKVISEDAVITKRIVVCKQ